MKTDGGIEIVGVRVLPGGRVSRADAAAILDKTPKTMCEWKAKGWGPRSFSVGGREFYNYDECLAMASGEKPIKPVSLAA